MTYSYSKMSNNIITINDEKTFDAYLNNQGKLIVIYYFDKTVGVCKQMLNELQKIGQLNPLSFFLIIALGDYQGQPKMYNGQTPPYFIFYLNGNILSNTSINNANVLADMVRTGQQRAMMALNQAQQQNKMINNNNNNYQQPYNNGNNFNYQQPNMPQQQQPVNNYTQQMMIQQMNTAGLAVPQFAQMQQMFIIFTNLQKMGVIPIPQVVGTMLMNNEISPVEVEKNEPRTLPDGSVLIPIEGGKFMIIEK